jgi:hypothetical protein
MQPLKSLAYIAIPIIVIATNSSAQTEIYSGPIGNPTAVLTNLARNELYTFSIASAGQQVTVNPTSQTLVFDKFQINTAPLTISKSLSVTVGFGQVKNYTLTLAFDAKVFEFNDGGVSHALSPSLNGKYDILGTGNGNYVTPVGGGNLTGSYTVNGPTQTAVGTFSVPINVYSYMMVPTILDASSYPSKLTLTRNDTQFHAFFDFASGGQSNVNFIDRTVDGQSIVWGFSETYISGSFGEVTSGALAAIPEPSTYATIIGSILLVFGIWKRRKKTSQSP